MSFKVEVARSAEQDIQSAFDWWREHRSAEDAIRWLDQIYPAIASLESMPRRCEQAVEHRGAQSELRQLLFGIGDRPTHRILFTIEGDTVTVLRVRHASQRTLDT